MTTDDEDTKPYGVERVIALDWLLALHTRRDLLDKLLAPLPENAEANAPRALLDC